MDVVKNVGVGLHLYHLEDVEDDRTLKMVKMPGEIGVGEDVALTLVQNEGDVMAPYERLLGDAMLGTPALFALEASVEEQWRIVEPILGSATPLYFYEKNTWGPAEADQIIAGDGFWYNPAQ